jgi:hypothetical protein
VTQQISKEEEKDVSKKLVEGFTTAVVVIILVAYLIHWLFTAIASDKYEYRDNRIIFIEARCLVGSLFTQDTIAISDDNIEINECSFFGKEKTVYPYGTLRRVGLSTAFIGYKVVIEYPGRFFGTNRVTLYFNQKPTFDLLRTVFKNCSANRCVVTESL